MIYKISYLLVLIVIIQSCFKENSRGEIRVSGYVEDTVKNKQLASAKVYLMECHHDSYRRRFCNTKVDSAITDINGNFSISYKSKNRSKQYVLVVGRDDKYSYEFPEQVNFDADNASGIRLKAQELNYLRLNVKVDTNPYDTLFILATHNKPITIKGGKIDTSILMKVLPNNINLIYYKIYALGRDSGAISRLITDTLAVGLEDTTFLSKRIISTYQMPLY